MFNPYDEYPHDIQVERTTTTTDRTTYPPKTVKETTVDDYKGLMDTPTTSEQLNFHNLNIRLDRNLFVPYCTDIKQSDVIIFNDVRYKIVGDDEDQGGQNEVLIFRLTRA